MEVRTYTFQFADGKIGDLIADKERTMATERTISSRLGQHLADVDEFHGAQAEIEKRVRALAHQRGVSLRDHYSSLLHEVLAANPELRDTYAGVVKRARSYTSDAVQAGDEVDRRVRGYCEEHGLDLARNYQIVLHNVLDDDPALKRRYAGTTK